MKHARNSLQHFFCSSATSSRTCARTTTTTTTTALLLLRLSARDAKFISFIILQISFPRHFIFAFSVGVRGFFSARSFSSAFGRVDQQQPAGPLPPPPWKEIILIYTTTLLLLFLFFFFVKMSRPEAFLSTEEGKTYVRARYSAEGKKEEREKKEKKE